MLLMPDINICCVLKIAGQNLVFGPQDLVFDHLQNFLKCAGITF